MDLSFNIALRSIVSTVCSSNLFINTSSPQPRYFPTTRRTKKGLTCIKGISAQEKDGFVKFGDGEFEWTKKRRRSWAESNRRYWNVGQRIRIQCDNHYTTKPLISPSLSETINYNHYKFSSHFALLPPRSLNSISLHLNPC